MFVTTDAGQAANDDLDAIHKKFGTTLKENPGYFLGMNITYVGLGKIHLSSRTYVENLEKRWAEACTGEKPIIPGDARLVKDYEQALNREIAPGGELLNRTVPRLAASFILSHVAVLMPRRRSPTLHARSPSPPSLWRLMPTNACATSSQ